MSKIALIGGAAVALAGTAIAADQSQHVLNVRLPNGAVQQVRYTGDVAPRVVLVPVAAVPMIPVDLASPFAEMDRISAAMDAQMDAMLRQAATLSASASAGAANGVTTAATGGMPAGSVSYSFVSTSNGKATCTQSVQMTSYGAGQQPKVVSQQAGDCSAMTKPLTQAAAPAPAPAASEPAIIKAKLDADPKAAPITHL